MKMNILGKLLIEDSMQRINKKSKSNQKGGRMVDKEEIPNQRIKSMVAMSIVKQVNQKDCITYPAKKNKKEEIQN